MVERAADAAGPAFGRRGAAVLAWWCEFVTLLLTAAYCGILAHDLAAGSDEKRLSSTSWFRQGFCVSWAERAFNSHALCFVGDLLGGGALLRENLRRYRQSHDPRLQVAVAVSGFTVAHGFGHLMIGVVLENDFMANVRPSQVPIAYTALYYTVASVFLSIGPFLGFCNGVPRSLCVATHLFAAFAFLEFVPTQFAFGFVQLNLNAWYCTPRVFLLGTSGPEEISKRVDNGWAMASYGFLALMPVVFAEMMACDSFVMALSGHFLYDGAIVLIAAAYSAALWRAGAGESSERKAA
mmetsp:Transcript_66747/g.169188  ORF Transcript_66747/g.169188 Transcript_66747/m.169188 type:complete len:295 (-) Transcript_66747:141-1025(-)